METIIQKNKEVCFLCGGCASECHHIFGGSRRKLSEEDGLKVYLCAECHRGTYGAHGTRGKSTQEKLHQIGEMAYLKSHSKEEFRERYGKNYV